MTGDTFCTGSETLVGNLASCACSGSCSASCTGFCGGGLPDATCQSCMIEICQTEFNACQADTGSGA